MTDNYKFQDVLQGLLSKNFLLSVVFLALGVLAYAFLGRIYRDYRNKKGPISKRHHIIARVIYDIARILVVVACAYGLIRESHVTGYLHLPENISASDELTYVDAQLQPYYIGFTLFVAFLALVAQDFLKDLFAGIRFINDDTLRTGNMVEINGREGIVLKFTLMTTVFKELSTEDIHIIYNRNITQVAKIRGSYVIKLRASYDEDFERVQQIMEAAADKVDSLDGIISAKYLGLDECDDIGMVHAIQFYCSPKNKYSMRRTALATAYKYIRDKNLHVPHLHIEATNPLGKGNPEAPAAESQAKAAEESLNPVESPDESIV